MTAGSPLKLDNKVAVLLSSICRHFPRCGLRVNWLPTKTDAFLAHLGRRAPAHYDLRRYGDKLQVRLPSSAGVELLKVVPHYKHLGGITCANGSLCKEGAASSQKANQALAPLKASALKSKELPERLRFSVVQAFVQTRLLFSIHTWTRAPIGPLKAIESMYMNSLRTATRQRWGEKRDQELKKQ